MKTKLVVSAIPWFIAFALFACASPPPNHPAYLHALTDLRDARWNLEHRTGDAAVSEQEDIAVAEIGRAMSDLKQAAFDDNLNLGDRPQGDTRPAHPQRLHRAGELLRKARAEVDTLEDNPLARELKIRALPHIVEALNATDRAIAEVERHR